MEPKQNSDVDVITQHGFHQSQTVNWMAAERASAERIAIKKIELPAAAQR